MEIAFNGNSKPFEEALCMQGNRQQWSFALPDVLNQEFGFFPILFEQHICTRTHK